MSIRLYASDLDYAKQTTFLSRLLLFCGALRASSHAPLNNTSLSADMNISMIYEQSLFYIAADIVHLK